MTTTVVLDQWLTREGGYQHMRIHEYGEESITVSATYDAYARLLHRLAINHAEVFASVDLASKGYTVDQACAVAQEMVNTIIHDQRGKRGRKYVLTVAVVDGNDGSVYSTFSTKE